MEVSPLSQQARPDSFQPKVVSLYETLFKEEEELEKSEGFWQEFFLHKPDPRRLNRLLASLSADDLLHLQAHPQQLLIRAIAKVKDGREPADEHALDTLTVFLGAVLNKKYTNPSSDIISVLAGLHDADAVFSDFVAALDGAVRGGRNVRLRLKAVKVALTMVSGAYATGLVSYFTHRDLFPSLMKFVQDTDSSSSLSPFILLGLLTNYNKFEFQNPYRLRLDDFVNEKAIRQIVGCIGEASRHARERYVEVQDDLPEGWSIGGTLAYIGLGALAGSTRPPAVTLTPEEAKARFTSLPGPAEAPFLLSTYDFANANKLFCFTLVSAPVPAAEKEKHVHGHDEPPMASYLSLISYLMQHAHRSPRAATYTYISLFTLQILVEDQALAKRLCSENESKMVVRLCRQRQPYLPLVRGERVLTAAILDICVDGVNHNLRRRLDCQLYVLTLGVVLRIISYLGRSRTRLAYHFSELWRSLLSFTRFLTTYVTDIKPLHQSSILISTLTNLLALALSTGETFLPDTASYDDLFYKLVETGDILQKFRDAYELGSSSASSGKAGGAGGRGASSSSSIDTLISVSRHYHSLLEGDGKTKGKKNLSMREVHKVIQGGYDSLNIMPGEGLDRWDAFREVDHRNVLKKAARIAVEDAKVGVEDV